MIVSALARGDGPYPIRLDNPAVASGRAGPIARRGPQTHRVVVGPPAETPRPAAKPPAAERAFSLLGREGDVASASNYLAVAGGSRAVGRRVQVYVDAGDVGGGGRRLLRDVVATFDDRVYPRRGRAIRAGRDVDGDGRFTVLMSSWLTRLGGRPATRSTASSAGPTSTRRCAAPFGNRCDMMYLSAALAPART